VQTHFTPDQLADPALANAEGIIRACVHCGFCTATCPTYVLLGDELDSPRGRIMLIKDMLENQRQPTARIVRHIDRCLSCLACMTTCPSGVNYMHLIDQARTYIATHHRRPLAARALRRLLALVLPHPRRFRTALALGRVARPLRPLFAAMPALKPLARMIELIPGGQHASAAATRPRSDQPAATPPRGRVALLRGCAEPVLRPAFQAAARRLLARAGYAVAEVPGEACCGALVHHMGLEADGLEAARRNVDAWSALMGDGLDAILVTASGCGTMLKDYGFLLRHDPAYAERAARVSALACDISTFLATIDLPPVHAQGLRVAWQAPCSLQHGQKETDAPLRLLRAAGFEVAVPRESHLCCGSAGTYAILQPELSGRLRDRKLASLAALGADVIATANVGCAGQLDNPETPVVHLVELLDWATGGPVPPLLESRGSPAVHPGSPR